jgi:hypothetical protein
MGYLTDGEADSIRRMLEGPQKDPLIAQWTRRLLEDRDARVHLIQRLARALFHTRRRLRQGVNYIDGLLKKAHDATRDPWDGKGYCLKCGAVAIGSTIDLRQSRPGEKGEHVLILIHPDGQQCEGGNHVSIAGMSRKDELGFPTAPAADPP